MKIGDSFNFIRSNIYDDGWIDEQGRFILRPECEKQVKQGIVSGFLKRPSNEKFNFEWTFLIDADTIEGDSGAGIFLDSSEAIIGVIKYVGRKQISNTVSIETEKIAVTFPPIRDLIYRVLIHEAGIKPEEIFYIPPQNSMN